MRLAIRKIPCLVAALLVTSALMAAEAQESVKPAGKALKKSKTQAVIPSEAVTAPPAVNVAKSATAEGALIFDSFNSRNRPRVALAFKESEDFKDIPNLTGLKTPEAPPPPDKPRTPTVEPVTPPPGEKGAPTDAPVAREKTPEDIEAQKAENAAAEAAELPVDIGPVE